MRSTNAGAQNCVFALSPFDKGCCKTEHPFSFAAFMSYIVMKNSFLVRLVINAVVFLIVSSLYSGIHVNDFWAAVLAALILGLINALIRPLLFVLTLPINFLTFGLFTFVLNALMLLLTDKLYGGLQIEGFWAAIIAAFLFSIVNAILSSMLVKDDER